MRSVAALMVIALGVAGCDAPQGRHGRGRDAGRASDAGRPPLPPRDDPDPPVPGPGPDDPPARDAGPPTDDPPVPPDDPTIPPEDPPPDDPPPGDPCMGVDYLGRCDGDVAVWCSRKGVLRMRDCADYGMVCGWIDDTYGYYCVDGAPPPDPDPDPVPDSGPRPVLDGGPGPDPGPVDDLDCRDWPEQHSDSSPAWGAVLTDIHRHLPSSYGTYYRDSDHVTSGHETSHGIHAHIRNYLNDTGARANGFYLPGGRACLIREPRMRKSDVAAYIPSTLRWSRYGTYISGATDWDDTPLYVWDEWNAYVNGAEVGIDRYRAGLWTGGWRGTVDGVIEFVVYGVAVAMAAEVRESGYFSREPDFLPFLRHELERSMTAFRAGQTIPVMEWDDQDAYYERLRAGSEAAAMRDWIRARFGAEWTMRVMGF